MDGELSVVGGHFLSAREAARRNLGSPVASISLTDLLFFREDLLSTNQHYSRTSLKTREGMPMEWPGRCTVMGKRRPSRLSRCSQQTERSGQGDGSATIIHTELLVDMFCMQLDRAGRHHQFARNFLVGEILVEQVQNLQLAPGQRLQALLLQEIFLRTSLRRHRVHRCQKALEVGIQMFVGRMTRFSALA